MKKYKKALIFATLIIIGIYLNEKFQLTAYLTSSSNLDEIVNFVEDNYIYSIFLYLSFTIIGSSILVLPGVTFAIVASGLFGPWFGSLYCLIGTTLGAMVSFILSRYLLKDFVEELVKKNEKLNNMISQVDSERETSILMITRLLPIFPFNLQNFAYGITNISLTKYSIATFLFMIPGIIIFSVGTEGAINGENRLNMFSILLLVIVLMVVTGRYVYKKYKQLMIRGYHER